MIEKLPYEELASWYRSASELNKKYVKEISQLKSQLQQKENIIKEVREYIEKNTEEKKSWLNGIPDYIVFKGDTKELLEILDKVEE